MVCCDFEHTVISAMFAGMNKSVWRDNDEVINCGCGDDHTLRLRCCVSTTGGI